MRLDQVWYEENDKSVTNNSLTPHSNPLGSKYFYSIHIHLMELGLLFYAPKTVLLTIFLFYLYKRHHTNIEYGKGLMLLLLLPS